MKFWCCLELRIKVYVSLSARFFGELALALQHVLNDATFGSLVAVGTTQELHQITRAA